MDGTVRHDKGIDLYRIPNIFSNGQKNGRAQMPIEVSE